MSRTIFPAVACAALLVVTAGQAADQPPHSLVDSDLHLSAPVHKPVTDLHPHSLSDQVMERAAGTGPATDFVCGFAAGAGFAIALSGVGAGAGAVLGGIGLACAMFF